MFLLLAAVCVLQLATACHDAHSCARAPRQSFDITTFGAIGDGVTVNTAAIQVDKYYYD